MKWKMWIPILILPLLLSAILPSAVSASSFLTANPVEVKLTSGDIVSGELVKISSNYITIEKNRDKAPTPTYIQSLKIPFYKIVGIRRPGETDFLPPNESPILKGDKYRPIIQTDKIGPVYRIREYKYLPVMGIAIIGGVYAGNRFAKASSERDAADIFRELELTKEADRLENKADDHQTQGIIGVLIGLLSLTIACLPSDEEIPLPTISSLNTGATDFIICFDVSEIVFGESAPAALHIGGSRPYPITAF